MDKGKMSKSSGNFLTLQYLIDQGYDPLDYRLFLVGAHFRSQITFSWESMDSAKNSRKSLLKQIIKLIEAAGTTGTAGAKAATGAGAAKNELAADSLARSYLDRFRLAVEQDLNTPRALSELQGLVRDSAVPAADALAALQIMDGVLGLDLVNSAAKLAETEKAAANESDPRIDALVAERIAAKKAKNFARADEIRNLLKAEGILLEDSASGTSWKRQIGGIPSGGQS
jgi:cysteinyl-tRNA synthetase